jgi:hypothetical protein
LIADAKSLGKAVVKMPVTSFNQAPMRRAVARKGSNSIVCSPPTYPRSVVKMADTSSVKREVAGSNPARRPMRR